MKQKVKAKTEGKSATSTLTRTLNQKFYIPLFSIGKT
jgi:hypothetical protein